MTLKSYTSELSQKAKAFSVESLLSVESDVEYLEKKFKKPFTVNSDLQVKNGITVELFGNVLWEKFNRLGTEMIVTRAGRRMFPTLKVRLHGLKFTDNYIVYMDIIPAGETRYRYNFQRSEWTIAGPSNNHTPNSIYIHPGSPATGKDWMSQEISFEKVKLTNNRKPLMKDQVSLHSMHKYQPRIHLLKINITGKQQTSNALLEYIREHSNKSETFIFEQTSFITVTAYQNQKITNLKIQSNPFAKGFREMSKHVISPEQDLINEISEKSIKSVNLRRGGLENLVHESYLDLVCPVHWNFGQAITAGSAQSLY